MIVKLILKVADYYYFLFIIILYNYPFPEPIILCGILGSLDFIPGDTGHKRGDKPMQGTITGTMDNSEWSISLPCMTLDGAGN